MIDYIAGRVLYFSEKGVTSRKKVIVKVSSPQPIDQATVKFPVTDDMAVCHVELEGLNEYSFDVYGMDSLQAINMASDVEAVLKRLSNKYDFFWSSGDPYFDE